MAKRQDATVSRQSPDERAKIEKARGIVRDEDGRIVRSKKWLEARIALLKDKRKDFAQRLENVDEEISLRSKELKSAK